MNINATFLGQVVAVLVIIMVILGDILGKRKTETPIGTMIVAFFTAFIHPLAIIFLMNLVLKRDIKSVQQ